MLKPVAYIYGPSIYNKLKTSLVVINDEGVNIAYTIPTLGQR